MNTPTTEEVNALIERLRQQTTHGEEAYFAVSGAVAMLPALRDENARLRGELDAANQHVKILQEQKAAAPAWVPISERKPTKEDLPYIWFNDQMELRYAPVGTVFIGSGQWSITHWMRVPTLPAPPESAEAKQAREDEEAYLVARRVSQHNLSFHEGWQSALAHARKERATP